jgi:hypothetical protein
MGGVMATRINPGTSGALLAAAAIGSGLTFRPKPREVPLGNYPYPQEPPSQIEQAIIAAAEQKRARRAAKRLKDRS